ncbi:MAG: DNA polymerase IV [Bacteroidota bacterium]|nr:DNA polymerase IV [Bacteroidota bacterium]MDP4233066.1 DNA polymerase IV [Bacteroidota bacterium]MDP4241789.1 DNA polymerase IV [Bacteroidota bacterium]MDP4288790.1 DNA polymerase IV [Bacteroidota bacterium]
MGTYNSFRHNILHLDLDTFFVSVERLLDPALAKRPVIVGGNPFGRGVVAGCNYEARAFGVHSAQPIRRAYRLCPQAVFLHGNYIHYAEYSKLVREILTDLAPICETSSVDEFYLDLSLTERLKGDTYRWAQEIRKTVSGETQLPLSCGLATNKLIAKVATTEVAKKGDARHFRVADGEEALFLSPFNIRALPGVGEVNETKLLQLGVRRIGQLAETPVPILSRFFGRKAGNNLHERAQGIDHSPVRPTHEQKSYSREQTFGEDTIDVQKLYSILLSLSSALASDLRKAKLLTSKLTLKLRYSDFTTVTKTLTCSWTNQDQSIYRLAEKLFRALWTRRVRVRLLGLEANTFLEDLEQQFLFEEEHDVDPLYSAIDSLREKYGKRIIGFAGASAPRMHVITPHGVAA